ncbi:hypothetical protein [Micromonospora globbae]|uniref:hypothetical protein n=1 Tax=Micromonospora globbae TaxID=1894969 RepID=UPI00379817AC
MSFRTESTLAGYALATVDLRARMTDYTRSRFAQQYLRAFPDGQPYRIWIHSYIKGPDAAPLLLGDTVSVLAR